MSRLDVSTIDSFIICSYAGGTRAARVRYLAGYRRAATTSLAETFFWPRRPKIGDRTRGR